MALGDAIRVLDAGWQQKLSVVKRQQTSGMLGLIGYTGLGGFLLVGFLMPVLIE